MWRAGPRRLEACAAILVVCLALASPPAHASGSAGEETREALGGLLSSLASLLPDDLRLPARAEGRPVARALAERETPEWMGTYEVESGAFTITHEGHESSVMVYRPKPKEGEGGADAKVWPAIVFGHGLCASINDYFLLLKHMSSWGFIVMGSDEMNYCDTSSTDALYRDQAHTNTTDFRDELVRNVKFLREHIQDVNASSIVLAGHSMGGGCAITAAAELEETDPGAVKAVIGIAPWNGVQPTPSDVAGSISAPLLLFCSQDDKLTPCEGKITQIVPWGFGWVSMGHFLGHYFPERFGEDWRGGILAIFQAARQSAARAMVGIRGANHYTILSGPMYEYTFEFLDRVVLGSAEAGPDLLGEAVDADPRLERAVQASRQDVKCVGGQCG